MIRGALMIPAVLSIDTEVWGVIIGACALAVSIYGVSYARRSAKAAERSAAASERSSDATVAAAEASARAAGAAEASAQYSERSTGAAERSATAEERGVAIEEEREHHEARARIDRDAPRWGPIGEDEQAWWKSNRNELSGALTNTGKVSADVTRAELDLPGGGGLVGRFRAEHTGPADGGFVTNLKVEPGHAIWIEFDTTDASLGTALQGDVRPRVLLTARSDDLDWEGTRTIELLRTPGDVTAEVRWKARAID
jgi:hypothetical protein